MDKKTKSVVWNRSAERVIENNFVCPNCKNKGMWKYLCTRCHGVGTIDWISLVTGSKQKLKLEIEINKDMMTSEISLILVSLHITKQDRKCEAGDSICVSELDEMPQQEYKVMMNELLMSKQKEHFKFKILRV